MLPDMRWRGRGLENADLPCGGTGTYEEVTVVRCFGWFGQAFQNCAQTYSKIRGGGNGEGKKDHNLGTTDCKGQSERPGLIW